MDKEHNEYSDSLKIVESKKSISKELEKHFADSFIESSFKNAIENVERVLKKNKYDERENKK